MTIDKNYVEKFVGDFAKDNDLSKFISKKSFVSIAGWRQMTIKQS